MLRPPKRPRLHFLGSVSPDPDGELAIARARNDDLLKTRWEHIFARYEKDFEGVGDEISMLEDKIVVDNGHIKSMQNAQDTGAARLLGQNTGSPSKYDGRRLLRAMTVAPSENSQDSASDNDADEILQSIETIADNIMISDDSSEDDLFNVQSPARPLPHAERLLQRHAKELEEAEIKSESDIDPLFNTRPVMRSPSVDDLFCVRSPVSHQSDLVPGEIWSGQTYSSAHTPETSFDSLPPRQTIDRALIREEVRKALEEENQAQEAKIEPAWRIPVRLIPSMNGQSAPAPGYQALQTPDMQVSDRESNTNEEESIWQPPKRTRRSRREVAAERSLKRLRAESEDPLQDGFTSEMEQLYETLQNSAKRRSRSKTNTIARCSHESSATGESALSLRRWQKTTPTDSVQKQCSSPTRNTAQQKSEGVTPLEKVSRRVRKGSLAQSSASDTIVVKVPAVERTMTKKMPNG